VINIQFPTKVSIGVKKSQQASKTIPTKAQDGYQRARRSQHLHNQTMVLTRQTESAVDSHK
jgi:hypothetical protein